MSYFEIGGFPMKTVTGGAIWIGLVLVFMSGAANAQDYYGAIAFSDSTGKTGYSYNYQSRSDAEQAALNNCAKNDCEIKTWFENSCGALAQGDDGSLGYSWAAGSRSAAESRAFSECDGSGCKILAWACTTR
jgi:hypothetical protein